MLLFVVAYSPLRLVTRGLFFFFFSFFFFQAGKRKLLERVILTSDNLNIIDKGIKIKKNGFPLTLDS